MRTLQTLTILVFLLACLCPVSAQHRGGNDQKSPDVKRETRPPQPRESRSVDRPRNNQPRVESRRDPGQRQNAQPQQYPKFRVGRPFVINRDYPSNRPRNDTRRIEPRNNNRNNGRPPRVVIEERNRRPEYQRRPTNVYNWRPRPRTYQRHSFRTSNNILSLIIIGSMLSNQNRYDSGIDIARQNGTYFNDRDNCLANFQAQYFETYNNDFEFEPVTRPYWIPRETTCDGVRVYVVFLREDNSYGFWDPNNKNYWIRYEVWDDTPMVNKLMRANYYLYR